MGNSYLTFNYTAAECCREVGHVVHQSGSGLMSERGRENKVGQAWPRKQAVSQWPHLWSSTHTCRHSSCLSLAVSNACLNAHTHTHTRTKTNVQKDKNFGRQSHVTTLFFRTPAAGPGCAFHTSHDTGSLLLGIFSVVPPCQPILHLLLPLPPFFPVLCLSGKQMCAQK